MGCTCGSSAGETSLYEVDLALGRSRTRFTYGFELSDERVEAKPSYGGVPRVSAGEIARELSWVAKLRVAQQGVVEDLLGSKSRARVA
ncbi:hypothetical protein [Streptomyces sp. NPDC001948]